MMAGIPRFDTTQELDLARPAQHNNPGQAKGDELATLRFLHTLVGNTQRRGGSEFTDTTLPIPIHRILE